MHIKFLKHGTGSGQKAADYLLGERDHTGKVRAGVEVMRGNPQHFGQVADSLEFTHRYTSGVIAWSPEDQPSDAQISAVLDDFEKVAFAGLEPDRYCWSAVKHLEDDGGVHVHVVAARVDLETGKSLNIAPPGWEKTFDPLRDYYNHSQGWARPDDPMRARMVQPGHQALIDASTLRQGLAVEPDTKALLTRYLTQRIEAGLIENRADLRASLEEIGEITREGKNYISVKPEGFDRAVRLKGVIYEQEFDAAAIREAAIKNGAGQEAGRRIDPERAKQAHQRLQEAVERRAEYNAQRYQRNAERTSGAEQRGQEGISQDVAETAADRSAVEPGAGSRNRERDVLTDEPGAGQDRHLEQAQPGAEGLGSGRAGVDYPGGEPVPDHGQGQREARGLRERQPPREVDHKNEELNHENHRIRGHFDQKGDRHAAGNGTAGSPFDRALAAAERAAKAVGEASKRLAATARRAGEGVRGMIKNCTDELERFKTEINLSEFLAGQGYRLDKGKSCQNYAVMRQGDEKLVVTRASDGHYVYTDAHNPDDAGSIIDYVQNRTRSNLGQVRKALRPWIGEHEPPKAELWQPVIKKTERDYAKVAMGWEKAGDVTDLSYLKSRKLSADTIRAYSANIRQSERGTLMFRHGDGNSRMSGYEYKSDEMYGFSKGGAKGLFVCRTGNPETITRLVITETALDALSYAQIDGCRDYTAYVSTAGNPSTEQIEHLTAVVQHTLKRLDSVVMAHDKDQGGEQQAQRLYQGIQAELADDRVSFTRETPKHGKDWNEQLQHQERQQYKGPSLGQ